MRAGEPRACCGCLPDSQQGLPANNHQSSRPVSASHLTLRCRVNHLRGVCAAVAGGGAAYLRGPQLAHFILDVQFCTSSSRHTHSFLCVPLTGLTAVYLQTKQTRQSFAGCTELALGTHLSDVFQNVRRGGAFSQPRRQAMCTSRLKLRNRKDELTDANHKPKVWTTSE
jgi:hypothetical protein